MDAGARRNIELHIEELVLEGFPETDQDRITAAVEKELSRLMSTGKISELLGQDNRTREVDGGRLEIEPGASAELTGIGIARSLYGGLKR